MSEEWKIGGTIGNEKISAKAEKTGGDSGSDLSKINSGYLFIFGIIIFWLLYLTISSKPSLVEQPSDSNSQVTSSASLPFTDYNVMVDAFKTAPEAYQLFTQLRTQRINARIYKSPDNNYVYIGPIPTEHRAKSILQLLEDKGYDRAYIYHREDNALREQQF